MLTNRNSAFVGANQEKGLQPLLDKLKTLEEKFDIKIIKEFAFIKAVLIKFEDKDFEQIKKLLQEDLVVEYFSENVAVKLPNGPQTF